MSRAVAVLILVVNVVLALAVTSQWVAARFGYDPRLGAGLYSAPPRIRLVWRWTALGAAAITALAIAAFLARRWISKGGRRRWPSAPFMVTVAALAASAALAAREAARAPIYGLAIVRWWRWWYVAERSGRPSPALAALWIQAGHVFWVAALSFAGVGTGLWLVWRLGRPAAVDGSRGTAAWGDTDVLERGRGVPLGWAAKGRSPALLRAPLEAHLITIAPSGTGKGVSAIIPALLDHPGSAVIIDPKGENYAVTAARRRAMGQEVVALDPFGELARLGVPAALAAVNPLDTLDVASPTGRRRSTRPGRDARRRCARPKW